MVNAIMKKFGANTVVLDSGNSKNVFNNEEWFPKLRKLDKTIRFVIANGVTSYVTHGGDAWAKLTDTKGNKILKCFKCSVLNSKYPVNLMCVAAMLKDKHGAMTNHDIDFKRDVVIYNEGLSNEARVKIHAVKGLPTMKIEPLTQSEKTKLMNRLAKSGMRAPEYRGRTKWRRTGKGGGKGSGGGKGLESSRSSGKGKGNGKGNGAGWGGWKPKKHCDNCQGHFDDEDDEESRRNLKWLKDSHNTKYCAQKGGKYENNLKGARLAERLAQQQRDAAKTQSSLVHHMKRKEASKGDSDEDSCNPHIYGCFAHFKTSRSDGSSSASEIDYDEWEDASYETHGHMRKRVRFAIDPPLEAHMHTQLSDTGTGKCQHQ
jgi:hypothetical protein